MQRPSPRARQLNRDPRTAKTTTPVSSWLNFAPLTLQPALWLDASDLSTITEAGGFVSQWNDKSGNNRHVSQATAASQPATGTRDIFGLNALDFDGSNDSLGSGSNSPTFTTISVFAALVKDGDGGAGFGRVFAVGTAQKRAIQNENGGITVIISYSSTNLLRSSDTAFFGTNTPMQINCTWNGGAVAVTSAFIRQARRNVTYATNVNGSGSLTAAGNDPMFVGNRSANDRGWDGAIGELIVYDKFLQESEVRLVENYLFSKWKV